MLEEENKTGVARLSGQFQSSSFYLILDINNAIYKCNLKAGEFGFVKDSPRIFNWYSNCVVRAITRKIGTSTRTKQ